MKKQEAVRPTEEMIRAAAPKADPKQAEIVQFYKEYQGEPIFQHRGENWQYCWALRQFWW